MEAGRQGGRPGSTSLLTGLGEATRSFWASIMPLQQGKKLSAEERKQMSEGNTKQSPALGGLQMATGPLWSEEPVAGAAGRAQSSNGCQLLRLPPINTN